MSFLSVLSLAWSLLMSAVGVHYVTRFASQQCVEGVEGVEGVDGDRRTECERHKAADLGNGTFLITLGVVTVLLWVCVAWARLRHAHQVDSEAASRHGAAIMINDTSYTVACIRHGLQLPHLHRVHVADDECSICLQPMGPESAVISIVGCNHAFHRQCIGEWLAVRRSCPLCCAPLVVVEPPPPFHTFEPHFLERSS